MPVHLLWGLTADLNEAQEGVSVYAPHTQPEEPIPDTSPLELRPEVTVEEE